MTDVLRLSGPTIERSGGRVRVRFGLRYQHDKMPSDVVTFELDEAWADWIDPSPAVLIPVTLVLAAHLGDDLHLESPLEADVRAACLRAFAVQARWFGWRTPELVAPTPTGRRSRSKRNRGLFFTGGIDSWGSYLALRDGPRRDRPTHLMTIDGDSHLPDEVRRGTVDRLRDLADLLGLPLVVIRSDLRRVYDPHTRWDYETHGGVLAGAGYLLRNGLRRVTIAATNAWPDAIPYGSHPGLDPLWTVPGLEVVHHGPEERRWERTSRVAADPVAQTHIDVCWEGRQTGNCGRCQKCLMTMTSLVLSGHTGWEGCFDTPWDPANISAVEAGNPTPTLITIEHCDRVGLRADPIRQRWEGVGSLPGYPYRYRVSPVGTRVPVRTPGGEPAGEELALAIGRLLAPLGCRVDHLAGERDPAATGPALVADLVDGIVQIAGDDRSLAPVTSPDDLIAPLARIGVDPTPEAAFDPDGQVWDDEAWARQRKLDPTSLDIPGVPSR